VDAVLARARRHSATPRHGRREPCNSPSPTTLCHLAGFVHHQHIYALGKLVLGSYPLGAVQNFVVAGLDPDQYVVVFLRTIDSRGVQKTGDEKFEQEIHSELTALINRTIGRTQHRRITFPLDYAFLLWEEDRRTMLRLTDNKTLQDNLSNALLGPDKCRAAEL